MITSLLLSLCLLTTPVFSSTKLIKDSTGQVPPHPEPCVMTCAGSTGAGITNWHVGGPDRIYTEVDITHCGFVDTPVVTTSLAGIGWHDLQKGVSAPWHISKSGFNIVVLDNGRVPTLALTREFKWHVNWIAVGYNCA